MDRAVKSCPIKLPTYAGLFCEDFIIFKDKFTKAAQEYKISRTDQEEKLCEVLTGKARAHLPTEGIRRIEHAWEYLEQAFCNPHTTQNFRLAKVKSMPSLTDKIEESDAEGAADWYLDMETAVNSILKLGGKSQELQFVAFNVKTTFTITSKLPYILLSKTYELDSQGEEKLKQVLQLIKKARVVANARATDMANMAPSSTTTNLWGCLMRKGPHPLGAVGSTTVWGGDTWACQLMTTRGSREILIGSEVDQITTDFPGVYLTEAIAEIKASSH